MKYFIVFIILFITSFISCSHYFENKLQIINNSNEDIYFDLSFDSELDSEKLTNYQGDTIKIGDSVRPPRRNLWENDIKKLSKDSTLTVFFIKTSLLRKKSWNEIYRNQQYKIYTFKIKDLDKLGWKIKYTGK